MKKKIKMTNIGYYILRVGKFNYCSIDLTFFPITMSKSLLHAPVLYFLGKNEGSLISLGIKHKDITN